MVQLLLESGALCERDTFQGERCLYNALNARIRNLLLSYDYSKSTDPLQPFAAHITSLLTRDTPHTSDILVTSVGESFRLHKFVLAARSPYFRKKLSAAPETASWKIPAAISPQAFGVAIRYVYLGEIPGELGGGPGTGFTEDEILEGLDKISKHLEIRSLWDAILESDDRRLSRQRRTEEVEKGRNQLEAWFMENVLRQKIIVDTDKADEIKWAQDNAIFSDVLLRADDFAASDMDISADSLGMPSDGTSGGSNTIPIGPLLPTSRSPSRARAARKSTIFPAHRAMLLRSDFFLAMFSSRFREAQYTEHLQIVPVDCTPDVLEIVLKFIYTEKTDVPLDLAIDVLLAADQLLIERLKTKTAVIISTLGNGTMPQFANERFVGAEASPGEEVINIYDVVRAGWLTRVPRLEEFGARYLASRLESYIDEEDFADLIRESAGRIQRRQETDSIELLDDIRYYLSERFRLRFEESGLEEILSETSPQDGSQPGSDPAVALVRDLKQNEAMEIPGGRDNSAHHSAISELEADLADDGFAGDAINYQILLGKIDKLLDRLKLDA